jgi:biotin-dependent carboxylase-like uncharacterized protein
LILELLAPGALCTVQDAGRAGFRHLGIPPAGAMDAAAMRLANRLLDNRPDAPVLECLAGARFKVLEPVQVALTGFGHARAWRAAAGEVIEISPALPGVWHSLALPGGIDAPRWMGSASICLRAQIGAAAKRGNRFAALADPLSAWPRGMDTRIKARYPSEAEAVEPRPIRLWPGPQWAQFSTKARKALVNQDWRVSQDSDRSGYRLEGAALAVPEGSLASEPVRVGAIQVPPDGQPIVCLNDGPTVGGYAKIAVIDPDDVRRLVQTRPGGTLRFTLAG